MSQRLPRVTLPDAESGLRGVTTDGHGRVSEMMTRTDRSRLRTLGLVVLVVVAVATPSACRPLPSQEVDLTETTWAVASVDGQPVDLQTQPTITFHDLDSVTLNSACGTVSAGLALETDSDGLGFAEPIIRSANPCDAGNEAEHRLLVDAILNTETWKVVDHRRIELTGSHVLLMERVWEPASG